MKMAVALATRIIGVLIIVPVLVLCLLGVTGHLGRPARYEISTPYQGWVTITYAKPDCPFLPSDGVFLVIRVDKSGKVCTNTPMPQGWQYTQIVYVHEDGSKSRIPLSAWGRRNLIQAWGMSSHVPEQSNPLFTEEWFIGTEEQLRISGLQDPSLPSNRTKELNQQ
jgi:hypothetical protein